MSENTYEVNLKWTNPGGGPYQVYVDQSDCPVNALIFRFVSDLSLQYFRFIQSILEMENVPDRDENFELVKLSIRDNKFKISENEYYIDEDFILGSIIVDKEYMKKYLDEFEYCRKMNNDTSFNIRCERIV
jgi:cellulose synthase/poly-beta-1,6-N-acetylglucosamine synthase-like glycosyltransferase